jgi:hypothetical protein
MTEPTEADNVSEAARNTLRAQGTSREPLRQESNGCFVATASCDDANSPHVRQLRAFRDEVLGKRRMGRWLIGKYNIYGPFAADAIRRSKIRRLLVRILIVYPAASISLLFVQRRR